MRKDKIMKKKKDFFKVLEKIPLWLKIGVMGSIIITIVYLVSFLASGNCSLKNMTMLCGINLLILSTFGYPFILIARYLGPEIMQGKLEIGVIFFSILLTSFFTLSIIGYIIQKFKKKKRWNS